jgi:DnaK suppressor protein
MLDDDQTATLMGRLSRMDAMQGQEMAKATQQRRKLQSRRIELALQRIEDGEYGLCRQCDEAIDPRRLAFDPTTPLCLDCASANESQ